MNPPDKAIAGAVLDRLMQLVFALRAEFDARDVEGRALNLGVVMFFGAVMAAIKEWEDREDMCQAALGYSMQASDLLERYRNRKDQ